jgi:autotransporter translocation and assembly factor TamB
MTVRRFLHRLILTSAILVVLIGGVMLAIAILRGTLGSQALARQIGTVLTQSLLDPATTRLRFEDVTGNPLTGLELTKVRLEVRADDGQGWVPVFAAKRIQVAYEPGELARGHFHFKSLHLVDPVFRLPGPGVRWPRARARGAPEPGPRAPLAIQVDALGLEGGRVLADSATAPRIGNLSVAGLGFDLRGRIEVAGSATRGQIDSLVLHPAGMSPLVLKGQIALQGSQLEIAGLTVKSRATAIWVEGGIDTKERRGTLTAELDPLDLTDARAFLGAEWLNRPGWVRGKVSADGALGDLNFKADLLAVAGADTVQRFAVEGRLEPEALTIGDLDLTFDEVNYHGAGWVGFGKLSPGTHGLVTFEDVDLRNLPGLRHRAGLPPGRLSGRLSVSAERRSPTGPVRPFELVVSEGEVAGLEIVDGRVLGALGRLDALELSEFTFSTRGADVRGAGRLDRNQVDFTQTITIGDLKALAGMLGESRVDGRGVITATLAGPLSAPGFTVEGDFDSLAAGAIMVEDAQVSIADGELQPDVVFSALVTAARGRVAGVQVDSLALVASYAQHAVKIERFAAARGPAVLSAAGAVTFAPDFLGFDLSQLHFAVGESQLENRGPIRVERHGQRWDFAHLEVGGPGGSFSVQGRVDPGIDTQIEVHAGDLDLAGLEWLHRLPGLQGRMDLRLEAEDHGQGLELAAELEADSVNVRGFWAERLKISAAAHRDTLTIRRATLERGGTIELAGLVVLPPDSALGFRRLSKRAFESARMALTIKAKDLDLAAWHGLHPGLDQVFGSLTLDATLEGTPRAPDGLITLQADSLTIAGESVGPVNCLAELNAGQLVLARAEVHPAGAPIVVIGPTPVHLSLLQAPTFDRAAPLDLTVDLQGASLGIARYFHDRVAEAEGELLGQVQVRGTLAAPQLSGTIDIAGGSVQVRGRDEVLDRVVGHVVFEGPVVRLVDVTATDGKKGRFTAEGEIVLDGPKVRGYDLRVEIVEFAVGAPGEYQGIIDGTFTLRKNMGGVGQLAEYSGSVRVRRLDYLREIVGKSRPSEPGPSSWVGIFTIDLPRNVWIRNTDLEAELKGRVTYEKTITGSVVLGEVETLRGRYDLFGHTFRITDGDVQFTDPEKIDPVVNVSAETRIPEARIFATITGRASDREVTLTSDPDYDQSTILKLLVPTGTSEVTSLLALTPVVQELERALSRQIPGLSLQMESRTAEGAEGSTLGARVGTYVVPELFISAYQGFSSSTEQDVSVEYGLSDIVFIKGSVVRRGVTAGVSGSDVLEEYNVDLNLRWEF